MFLVTDSNWSNYDEHLVMSHGRDRGKESTPNDPWLLSIGRYGPCTVRIVYVKWLLFWFRVSRLLRNSIVSTIYPVPTLSLDLKNVETSVKVCLGLEECLSESLRSSAGLSNKPPLRIPLGHQSRLVLLCRLIEGTPGTGGRGALEKTWSETHRLQYDQLNLIEPYYKLCLTELIY